MVKLQLRAQKACLMNDYKLFQRFRYEWEKRRVRLVYEDKSVKFASEKGLHVQTPQEIFTPAFPAIPYHTEPEPVPTEKPPCYILTSKFKPIENLRQVQVLTNTLTFNSMPSVFSAGDISEGETSMLNRAILLSHLFDSKQKRTPCLLENTEFVYRFGPNPFQYDGITLPYRIDNLTKNMLELMSKTHKLNESRYFMQKVEANVELVNNDLFHLKLPISVMMSSEKPLSPIMNTEDVEETSKNELPNIYPLLPFVHRGVRQSTIYDEIINSCGSNVVRRYPHTVFVHDENPFFKDDPPVYEGMALLHAFAAASAWARQNQQLKPGDDLNIPVTLNVVYTNGRHFQVGTLQLNTLNLTGQKKNLFWRVPWSRLFWNCHYDSQPSLEQVDPLPYQMIKGLYAMEG